MDNPQLVDYIREQMAAGHTEEPIRQHLLAHGWSADKVDAAFVQSGRGSSADPVPSKRERKAAERHRYSELRRGGRDNVRHKPRTGRRVSLAVLVAILVIGGWLWWHHGAAPKLPAVHAPTYQQKQSLDVVTLGGAVGQYVATNNKTLPTRLAPAPDGSNSVVLCGDVCNPASWQVSSLSTYKPSGVHMLAYAPGLTVPNASTLYIVSGARCTSDSSAPPTRGAASLSAVILYATETDGALQQHCVIL